MVERIYKGTNGGICLVCQNKKGRRERVGIRMRKRHESKNTRSQKVV